MYDTYALLKAEGTQFPPVNESIDGILLETAAAPEWSDSDVCDRCRTPFTMTNRKHHCRRCGGTFCQQCSAKTMPLPQLGINEPVRVCDGCHIKLQLDKANIKTSLSTPITPKATTSTSVPTTTNTTSAGTEEFDDDIKKAIELSLKEAEQQKNSYGSGYVAPQQQQQQQQQKAPEPKADTLEDDPDLAAAIAASLRDIEISNNQSYSQPQQYQQKQVNKDELSPVEMENILLFSTLMDRVFATGGDVSNDPQINQLYTQIGTLQPKLVKNLDDTIRKRNQFIEVHEKLNMAVKAYDRLLEERIANVRQQQGGGGGGYIPEQLYQQQPLYHQQQQPMYPPTNDNYYGQQQDTNKYYQTSAPPHDAYYASPPVANEPNNNNYYPPQPQQVNNQDMSHYYSAPPHYPQQQQQQQQPVEQKKPVEEAPLIDL
ncbi:unnamed protein product [Mucor hiemalis]